ncbi:MAG: hypothetical protein ACJ73J_10540 [Actinomycetes bacterium]
MTAGANVGRHAQTPNDGMADAVAQPINRSSRGGTPLGGSATVATVPERLLRPVDDLGDLAHGRRGGVRRALILV